MNNGEANIDTREAVLKSPMTVCRIERSFMCKLPTTIIAKNPKTATSNPYILICQQLGKKRRNKKFRKNKKNPELITNAVKYRGGK